MGCLPQHFSLVLFWCNETPDPSLEHRQWCTDYRSPSPNASRPFFHTFHRGTGRVWVPSLSRVGPALHPIPARPYTRSPPGPRHPHHPRRLPWLSQSLQRNANPPSTKSEILSNHRWRRGPLCRADQKRKQAPANLGSQFIACLPSQTFSFAAHNASI